jgi:carbamoylphosphate synthase large subunit
MWWPLSARLASAFLRQSCRVAAICPPGHPLRFVAGIEPVILYKGLDSIGALRRAIVTVQPDLIVPCDDGVVWQLHEIHEDNVALRPLIESSLGSPEAFATIRSRGAMLKVAAELGIRIPRTNAVNSEAELRALWRDEPVVLKLDGTFGGTGVAIARSLAEAVSAYQRLSQPLRAGVAWKRWLINREPIALWSWRKHEAASITMQEFIDGRPANTMFACWRGEVLAIVSVEVITAQGTTGAATVVRLVQNKEIEEAAKKLAKKFCLSGFHGLDFVLDRRDGAAYLIELNPRSTQLGHLRLPGQGNLAGALSAKLNAEPPSGEAALAAIEGETIAFFPQASQWNPNNPYLKTAFHDVPNDDPELKRELLRKAWPTRRLLYRVYHYFREIETQEEVKF